MVQAPSSYPTMMAPCVGPKADKRPVWLDQVCHFCPTFTSWPEDRTRPRDTKGNKPLVDVGGEPAFGEIAILRAFQASGWDGRWIDNYPLPPTFRVEYWDDQWETLPRHRANRPLPPVVEEVYRRICAEAGDPSGGGAWDVIAWRGDEMVFIEAKKRGSSDRIKEPQLRWLNALARLDIPRESRLFVEWTLR